MFWADKINEGHLVNVARECSVLGQFLKTTKTKWSIALQTGPIQESCPPGTRMVAMEKHNPLPIGEVDQRLSQEF